jgi:hypothetical protein
VGETPREEDIPNINKGQGEVKVEEGGLSLLLTSLAMAATRDPPTKMEIKEQAKEVGGREELGVMNTRRREGGQNANNRRPSGDQSQRQASRMKVGTFDLQQSMLIKAQKR